MAKKLPSDEKLLKRAEREVMRIARFMGLLQTWQIAVRIEDLNEDREPGQRRGGNVEWVRHYQKATIKFDRKFTAEACDTDFEHCVLHELVHMIMAPMDDFLEEYIGDKSYVYYQFCEHRERVVDSLTNLLIRARDGGYIGYDVQYSKRKGTRTHGRTL